MVGAIGLIVLIVGIVFIITNIGKGVNYIRDKNEKPTKSQSNKNDIGDEVSRLKKLHSEGLIDEQNIASAQKKVLDKHLK